MLPGSTGQTCKFPSLTCLKKLTVYFEILMALHNSSDKGFIFLAVRKDRQFINMGQFIFYC